MFTSLLGIRVVLWIGQTVPLPVPRPLLEALTQVTVTNDVARGDGFELTFSMGRQTGADYAIILSGIVDTFNRVIIGVVLGTDAQPLIDGVITEHHLVPTSEPGKGTLTVRGSSVLRMLDLEEKNQVFKNMSDSLIVRQVLLPYAQYGILPTSVMETANVRIEIQGNTHQHERDLGFLKRLARKNGYVFYIEPMTFGVNDAYFGPELRVGMIQPSLLMNMGPSSNLRQISFGNDGLAPTAASGSFVEPMSKTTIPIPAVPALRMPPLSSNPISARRTARLRQSANQDAPEALLTALAASTGSPEGVTANGEIDGLRYGAVLRARRLVCIRGVGDSYDGVFYVHRVTHTIKPHGDYSQQFSVRREGTGSLLPFCP